MHKVSGRQAMNFYRTVDPTHLRLGQAFLNRFFPTVIDSKLFYETDKNKAWKMIIEQYVDWESAE